MDVNDYVCCLNKRGVIAFFREQARSYSDCPEHQPLPRSGFCIF
jgi:hypothetical protein